MTRSPTLVGRTRGEVVADLARRLGSAAEARWLVDHVAGDAPGARLDDRQLAELASLADRRRDGEPLQYVLGTWPFRTVELLVDARALVPRPETEQVVEVAIGLVRPEGVRGPRGPADLAPDGRGSPVVVDLGTGTGAIALSMAVELAPSHPGLVVWAADDDAGALALAVENRERVNAAWPDADVAGRVRIVSGWWYEALPRDLRGQVDLVVANPPYVAEDEWAGLQPEVRREPRRALVAPNGSDGTPGLAAVEAVLAGGSSWLAPGGAAVVELAPHQASPATALARRLGYRQVELARDLAGRDRALVARR